VRHLLRALGVRGPHQEPHLRGGGDRTKHPGPGRSRTSTSTASTTRANGKTPAFATCSRRRPEAGRMAREGRGACCPVPDLRLHIDPRAPTTTRAVRLQALHAARPGRATAAMSRPASRASPARRAACCLLLGGTGAAAQGPQGPGARTSWPCACGRPRTTPASRSNRHGAGNAHHFLTPSTGPNRLVVDIDGLELSPQLQGPGRQGARRRPLHRRRARRPEPAARGAAGDRPEAADIKPQVFTLAPVAPTSTGWCSTCTPRRTRPAAGPAARQGTLAAERSRPPARGSPGA
jgi:hypothetical protein